MILDAHSQIIVFDSSSALGEIFGLGCAGNYLPHVSGTWASVIQEHRFVLLPKHVWTAAIR